MDVKKGQHIACVGQLYENDGTIPYKFTMLHFELYKNTATGSFTQKENISKYDYVKIRPYKRRQDLLDATELLDEMELKS